MVLTMRTRFRPLYKRINCTDSWRQLIFTVGAILFISIINSTPTNALSLDFSGIKLETPSSKLKSLQEKIQEREEIVKKKTDAVKKIDEDYQKHEEQMSDVEQKKIDIQNAIQEIQRKIDEAKDLFVNITSYAPDAAGNAYALGNCTWYVKQKRPDIGNFWGNANRWISSAQAQGFATGSKAKVGAIGVTQEGGMGHVVYVEKIGKGVVRISEMNYNGLYNMSTRTVPESSFQYIYAMK